MLHEDGVERWAKVHPAEGDRSGDPERTGERTPPLRHIGSSLVDLSDDATLDAQLERISQAVFGAPCPRFAAGAAPTNPVLVPKEASSHG